MLRNLSSRFLDRSTHHRNHRTSLSRSARQGARPVNEDLVRALSGHIATFLCVDSTVLGPHTSVALGLSSLQAVALAKALNDDGFAVSPVDIIQADSVAKLAESPQDT